MKRKSTGIDHLVLANLKAAPWNPRSISPEALAGLTASLGEFGDISGLVWNRRSGNLVAGHQRLKALREKHGDGLKMEGGAVVTPDGERFPVRVVDWPAAKEKAANVAANNPHLAGEFTDGLAAILDEIKAELPDLSDALLLDALRLDMPAAEVVQDEVPPVAEGEPESKRGEVYQCGRHRVMCGDSATDDWQNLLGAVQLPLVITSPPYGVGKSYEVRGIAEWFANVMPVIRNITKTVEVCVWNIGDLFPTGTQFIEPTLVYSLSAFMENGMKPLWIRIWQKQGQNYGVGPYHLASTKPVQEHEYIAALSRLREESELPTCEEIEWLPAFAKAQHRFVKRLSKEERRQWGYSAVWRMNTVRANKEHPAMFPIELPARCIKMFTDTGGVVGDPFLGSGTTLIAAEQLGRICYGMEIEPRYVDVIRRRYHKFVTGAEYGWQTATAKIE